MVCAGCGKGDRLYQDVEVEATATEDVFARLDAKGKVELDSDDGSVDITEVFYTRSPLNNMGCRRCRKTWWPPEKGLTEEIRDYRCEKCGWWGRQDWLHSHESPDCNGELTSERAPLIPQEQIAA